MDDTTSQQEADMTTPAVAYVRVSGVGQVDGQGLDRQLTAIQAFAAKAGYSLDATYKDVHTGTDDALNRPGFSDMVANLNGTTTIIVERLDRLARSILVQETAITWLAAHGFDLLIADTAENVTESYMGDPMKRALIQMQGIFAELEKSMLVKKLRIAREKKRKENGKCEGRKAYGEVDEDEQKIVRRIFDLREMKCAYYVIADVLNNERHRTRMGNRWSEYSVGSVYRMARKREGTT